jgi:hypothetical protein
MRLGNISLLRTHDDAGRMVPDGRIVVSPRSQYLPSAKEDAFIINSGTGTGTGTGTYRYRYTSRHGKVRTGTVPGGP